jgi:DNA-binding PadR family transcriptional regulator
MIAISQNGGKMAENTSKSPGSHIPLQPTDFEILLSLNDSEKHGYGIIQDIEERTQGIVSLGTSTLYAIIRRLLAASIVEEAGSKSKKVSGGPPRRYYRLTDLGQKVMRLEAIRLQDVAAAARERILEFEPGS